MFNGCAFGMLQASRALQPAKHHTRQSSTVAGGRSCSVRVPYQEDQESCPCPQMRTYYGAHTLHMHTHVHTLRLSVLVLCGFGCLQVEGMMDATYASFLSEVSNGRQMSREAVREVAKGRVWSGSQAVEVRAVPIGLCLSLSSRWWVG